MLLSIVLPAYNEADRIARGLTRLSHYLATVSWEYEVLVVDDGSTDDTARRVEQHPLAVRLLRLGTNQGKGAAVRTGALAASGEFLLVTDVDLSTPIETLDTFLEEITDADIVIGSRSIRGAQVVRPQQLVKIALGRFGNLLIRLFAVPQFKDTQNGFKLFRLSSTRRLFELQRRTRWGYDFEILFLAQKRRLRVKELPVVWRNDERSKVGGMDYLQTLTELFLLRFDQLRGKYS